MRRLCIGGLAALLLIPVLIARAGPRPDTDPEKALADINAWYQEQIKTAQANKQPIDGRKLMADRLEKAKAAVAGVNAESVAPEKGLAWAQLFGMAQMQNELLASAARFLTTNPDPPRKYQAQSMMLAAYDQTGQADKLVQLLGEVKPPAPQAAAMLAMMTANSYSDTIAEKLGPQKALDILQKMEAQVPFGELKTDQEKNLGDAVVVYAATSKSDLLNRLGKRDEALTALESAKGRLNPGSRMLKSLESKLVQARLPGTPAPILKQAQAIGEFPGLESWKGKVVVLDFFAHW